MSPLLSRIAALGLLAAAIGLAAAVVGLPVADALSERADERARLEDRLARFEARIGGTEAPAPLAVDEPALLPGGTPAVAAAELQGRLDRAVAEAGGTISSLRVETAVPGDSVLRVPVTAEIEIPMEGLGRLLIAVAAARPYLVVERLDARPLRARDPDGPLRLALTLRVFAMTAPAG